MNRSRRLAAGAALALGLVAGCRSSGVQPVPAPTQEQMMAKWMAFMAPGAGHELLARKAGNWSMVVKIYSPGAEPMVTTGTSDMKLIMDGRYLEDRTVGEVMGGQFLGLGYVAFDNLKQRYVYTWVDNLGTGIMSGEGTYDAARKTASFTATGPDVIRGQYVPMRSTETWTDDDHWTVRSWGPDYDGKEMLMMEIAYTRM